LVKRRRRGGMKGEIEERKKLIEQDKTFRKKYPKIYSYFAFYKNLFSLLENQVKNTVIREAELGYFPLWTETSLHDGLAVISVLKGYAKELEEHGYYIDITGEKVPIDEVIFHEFLHVLGLFNPKMFEPSPLIIDDVPTRLTHENPPKTISELRTRIEQINQWYYLNKIKKNRKGIVLKFRRK